MSDYTHDLYDGDDFYEDAALDREAVKALVNRHHEEYLELVKGTQRAEIERLEEENSRNLRRIRELEEKLERAEETKKRWAQRIASGITELDR